MYSLAEYGLMMSDRVRMDAYREALRRTVKPGSLVVDLGAGAGVMSFIALELGANKVYAIDPSDSLEVARAIARANGLESRIVFHRGLSREMHLPERADVIVSDMRGVLSPHGDYFGAIADARSRFLKPGGTLIPHRDTLWLALAESPADYADLVDGWKLDEVDLSIGRRMAANSWSKRRIVHDQLISEPAKWAEIEYDSVSEPTVSGIVKVDVRRQGIAHGIAAWFDAELTEHVGFSNAPGRPPALYGQAFFPLLEPVSIDCDDQVIVNLRADLTGEAYTWSWQTHVRSAAGSCKADYRQSTFFGTSLSADNLRKRADMFVPVPSEDARIDRAILEMFACGPSLREIATQVASAFPERFSDWKGALDRVAALSVRYAL